MPRLELLVIVVVRELLELVASCSNIEGDAICDGREGKRDGGEGFPFCDIYLASSRRSSFACCIGYQLASILDLPCISQRDACCQLSNRSTSCEYNMLPIYALALILWCSSVASFVIFDHAPFSKILLRSSYSETAIDEITKHAHPLSKLQYNSYKDLINVIPENTKVVLIGEGTHGTQEFFEIRAEITRSLIEHHGFDAVICEGDVLPFMKLNRYVTSNSSSTQTTLQVRDMLTELFCHHFPDWMWCNTPMAGFVVWLKGYNNDRSNHPVRLLGMDIQHPFDSMDFVMEQLNALNEHSLEAFATEQYATLNKFRPNARKYGDAIFGNKMPSQEMAVRQVFEKMLDSYNHLFQRRKSSGDYSPNASIWYEILENSRAVVASESYHRKRIYPGHVTTWNERSLAFMATVDRIVGHIDSSDYEAIVPLKVIVWAHNSHVGDMSATGYSSFGQTNLGQLCREHYGLDSVYLIGMTTFKGTVRAAFADKAGRCWQGKGEVQTITEALKNSHESVLHSVASNVHHIFGENSFGLSPKSCKKEVQSLFSSPLNERFIGSCYLRNSESVSHYSVCDLASQFDYVFHIDESTALSTS